MAPRSGHAPVRRIESGWFRWTFSWDVSSDATLARAVAYATKVWSAGVSDGFPPLVDVVRASRDGHEFHEAWAARTALELIPPGTSLTSIAIEGFAEADTQDLSAEAHDIADLVRYRGGHSFDCADRVETVQFKYSIAKAFEPMTAGSMTKTLGKFAAAESDIIAKWGDEGLSKASFELVTNRPIDADVLGALDAIRTGANLEGRAASQAKTLIKAIGLEGDRLSAFARRLSITGTGGSLANVDHRNLATLSSWSGATDSVTRLRLGNLRKLVRNTAGGAGQANNRLERVDILGALDVAREDELYPVRAAFPPIPDLIEREAMSTIIEAVLATQRPLLLHAAGGFGKTAIMQAIARHFEDEDDMVLLFDGFGAGEWRNPSDARHLPHKALPYLANLLAAKGLCDILIAGSLVEDLVRAFREHLAAAVNARRRYKPASRIIVLLDAADHAGMQAERTKTTSFAHLLLETLSISPIDGVVVVASCRTHRRKEARGDAQCRELLIPGFSPTEVAKLVDARIGDATAAELVVLESHSRGNPRLLDSILRRGRPFDRESAPTDSEQGLVTLLTEQIDAASEAAIMRGARDEDIRGLLAGLALLPPPVPVDELAAALAIDASEVEGFVADLFPLIATTATGLIFRDEPTETLVSEMVAKDDWAQDDLLARLEKRQSQSVYAARALPAVLTQLDRVEALVELAFIDQPIRPDLSKVADRAIKGARVKAAAIASARAGKIDELARIAMEAVRIGSATERSDAFLRDYPDIVGVSGDPEAIRRLRDDRSMWSARRHAALAVLEVFLGNREAAMLEAERSISWINRNFRLRRDQDPAAVTDDAEALSGALLVELLEGNGVRIERFLRRWNASYAYRIASRILALVERLAHARGVEAVAPAVEALADCRTHCAAVLASTLGLRLLSDDARKKITRKFAKARVIPQDTGYHYNSDRSFDRAVHVAAARAVSIGLKREALAVLKHAPALEVRSYTFSDPWPLSGDLGDFLRIAAIRRATRTRPTALIDIAPRDMIEAVPASALRKGPAAFAKALDKLILGTEGPKKKRKTDKISTDDARTWRNLLSHRMGLLATLVDQTAAILTANDPTPAIVSSLDAARSRMDSAENYPIRDQKGFIAVRAFELLRWAAAQRATLDTAAGDALADFLIQSDIRLVPVWLDTIKLLAQAPACHAAALRLAQAAGPVIAADTEIVTQVKGYGELSVALWPLSTDEARVYFKKGLDLADGVGSGDQERIAELLAFAANYVGPPLATETVHRLSLLCELNLPDEPEGFDWFSFGTAYARIDGPRSLAFLGRLVERDKVALGVTLPSVLSALVNQQRLAPELAAGIGFLDPFSARWDWRAPAFARPIMEALEPVHRTSFADELVLELDRSDTNFAGNENLESYQKLFADTLPTAAPARVRIEQWLAIKKQADDTPRDVAARQAPAELTGATPIDATELDAVIAAEIAKYDDHKPAAGFIVNGFVDLLAQPLQRTWLLGAAMASATLTFRQKLSFLASAKDHWSGQSLALDERIANAVRELALRHLDQAVSSGEEFRRPIDRIVWVAGDTAPDLVSAVITALAGHNLDISSVFWMTCARVLAKAASPTAISLALDRFTRLATDSLPRSIGDGPWSSHFDVTGSEGEMVAGLIWLRLGSPEAASRWRAAHAVRRLCAYGRHDVLDALAAMLERSDAGAYQDRGLPFFDMHAKLWLLIAMARIGVDRPELIAPHRKALKAIATNRIFPHVLMRHFAIAALGAGLPALPAAETALLDTLNRPRLPSAQWSEHRANHYGGRPEANPELSDMFRFDYDFSKYQFDPLGEVFGVPTWEIGDRAHRWVREWNSSIHAMWDCPRPGHRDRERDWSSDSFSDRDLFGGYLGRHALFCTAGELADTRPAVVGRYSDESNPWPGWIEGIGLSRSDQLWLADGTDLFPLDDVRPIMAKPSKGEPDDVPAHPLDLLPIAGISDQLAIPPWLRVSAEWESSDGLSVSVSSRLIEPARARIAAHALQSAPPGHAFFPHEDDRRVFDDSPAPYFDRWLTGWPDNYARLDGQDPYGHIVALSRRAPTDMTAAATGTHVADAFGRRWVTHAGAALFNATAWGAAWGQRQHRTGRSGRRLAVSGMAVQKLLADLDRAMILHVKIRKHLDNNEIGDKAYRQQVLTCIVRADGSVEPVWKTPKRIAQAIAALDLYSRTEFDPRYRIVEANGPLRAIAWPKKRPRIGVGETPKDAR